MEDKMIINVYKLPLLKFYRIHIPSLLGEGAQRADEVGGRRRRMGR